MGSKKITNRYKEKISEELEMISSSDEGTRLLAIGRMEKKFLETFPEIAPDKLRLFEEYDRQYEVSIQYLGVPLWFSETFIIDHQNANSY